MISLYCLSVVLLLNLLCWVPELIITAGGENIPPVPTEDAVKEAVPLISNAMLIGDKRKFLSMLLTVKVNNQTGSKQTTDVCQFNQGSDG